MTDEDMAKWLRPGTFAKTQFIGVIRYRSAPWAQCVHKHRTSQEARDCSKMAFEVWRRTGGLPNGWVDSESAQ